MAGTVVKLALLQLASPDTESQPERIARVGRMVAELDPVDLIVLPELWAPGYFAFDRYAELSQPADGELRATIASWARERGTHVQAGSILERDDAGRIHNTALLFGPDGATLLAYDKVHVFGYESLEAELLTPGDSAAVAHTALGTVAMTTCYDLRFPELYRYLVDLGAQLIIVPAAWPVARLEHWKLFTRVRAVENELFVIACGAAGAQGGVQLSGCSVVVDPWGRAVAEAGEREQVLYAQLDIDAVARTRAQFPVLDDRMIRARYSFEPSGRTVPPKQTT